MTGRKTHEQQIRTFERKPDVPDTRQMEEERSRLQENPPSRLPKHAERQSEYPVSRGGTNQESDHNKHNDPGQPGHKPQKRSPAQQKQLKPPQGE